MTSISKLREYQGITDGDHANEQTGTWRNNMLPICTCRSSGISASRAPFAQCPTSTEPDRLQLDHTWRNSCICTADGKGRD